MTDERFENDKRAILALAAAAKKAGEGMQDAVRRAKPPDLHAVASECDLYGHDYQVNEYGITATGPKSREPSELFCSVCGESWKVER